MLVINELVPDNKIDNDDFEKILNNKLIGNFKIKVGDTIYFVSKDVLIMNSEEFNKILSKDSNKNEIVIKGFEPRAVLEMLRFLYLGKIKNSSIVALDLYKLGEKYNISDLKRVGEEAIRKALTGQQTDCIVKKEEVQIN